MQAVDGAIRHVDLGDVLLSHDPQGAVQPQVFVQHIGQRQKGFDAVHVAVGTAIRFARAPVTGERLQQRAFGFAPERVFQQLHGIPE